jgi:POT family proton-dependent oligopeptide transporter
MNKPKYRTAPVPSTRMPSGIPYIIGNEAAERFSFYGMKGILTVFMTQYLIDSDGQTDVLSEENAKVWYHVFTMAVYFTPFFGALLSDIFIGKYKTILSLSVIYCLGHLALALDETRTGLTVGLTLIAIGSGGIKPCVSAHVGDQFGKTNQHLLGKVFGWFYFSINLGAFASTLLTPWLLAHEDFGPHWAFGVPGFLMLLATICFWAGRHRFVHVPPGGKAFVKEIFNREGLKIIGKLSIIYFFVSVFWSLFDQTGSAWVLQAEKMDRHLFGTELLSSQIQAANPLLVMILIPVCSYLLYPALNRVFELTALRKILIGFFITIGAFTLSALIQSKIDAGETPNIIWQLLAYLILTMGEVMVSITCLEFSYTQASNKMKSFIMSLFMISIALGNGITAFVNNFIQNPDGTTKLEGADYYWFFTGLMFTTAVLFIFVAVFYKERTYIQDEDPG